jgi:hypothetical protein
MMSDERPVKSGGVTMLNAKASQRGRRRAVNMRGSTRQPPVIRHESAPTPRSDGLATEPPPGELTASAPHDEMLKTMTGCKTNPAALLVLRQVSELGEALIEHPTADRRREALQRAIAMLEELEPKTGTESLLAAQMIGTQQLAMRFLTRAMADAQTFEGINANVTRASRMMRLFLDQADAMARLKGKTGQQHVTVEHVTVTAGGQAIVGTVMPREPRIADGAS